MDHRCLTPPAPGVLIVNQSFPLVLAGTPWSSLVPPGTAGTPWSSLVPPGTAGTPWSSLVPPGPRWYPLVLLVPPGPRWYPLVLLVPPGPRWYPLVLAGTPWSSLVPPGSTSFPHFTLELFFQGFFLFTMSFLYQRTVKHTLPQSSGASIVSSCTDGRLNTHSLSPLVPPSSPPGTRTVKHTLPQSSGASIVSPRDEDG
ncbi:hypothetical protein NHX12_027687 [Muraenolepis orangiensis]|uniref:Uncharacterized protein n=1 Tax=Muraenolepis orangiensis TaxID=630683 RepID=A0A9Q0EJF5_9TELE|nr:hypothetical protein NHX12_027687 [Muraenolepis orangiensis]